MRFKPFLGYMLFVTIRMRLVCQKWDLIETESETYKSQMYGHNASNLCHPYILSTTVLSDNQQELATLNGITIASSLPLEHTKWYIGLIRHSFSSGLDTKAKKNLVLLVRSQLSYGSKVWRPHFIKDIIMLERIQRRATKYILND